MRLLVYLALGGMAGTCARYGLQGLIQSPGGTFPWGTLVVNLSGAVLLGFLMRYLLGSGLAGPDVRSPIAIAEPG